jgi:predicted RNA-binding Zn-ribbon protein involved in translation (DUF1610 family)
MTTEELRQQTEVKDAINRLKTRFPDPDDIPTDQDMGIWVNPESGSVFTSLLGNRRRIVTMETTTQETLTGLPCPKCGKTFKNAMAMRMHTLRKHSGKGWDTSANFRHGLARKSREKLLLAKREYNRRLRARYKLEGKDSRGYPLDKRWSNLNRKGGKPWTDAQREKFRRTMKAKARHRIQIVYPEPTDKPGIELAQVYVPTLKHCPNCGENIEGWKYQP